MTYIDRLNKFFDLVAHRNISKSTQLLYLHLLNINNRLRWQKWFPVSLDRLSQITQLPKSTIIDCRRVLKNLNLVDFRNKSGTTEYFLQVELRTDPQTEYKPNAEPTPAFISDTSNYITNKTEKNAQAIKRRQLTISEYPKQSLVYQAWIQLEDKDRWANKTIFDLPMTNPIYKAHLEDSARKKQLTNQDFLHIM